MSRHSATGRLENPTITALAAKLGKWWPIGVLATLIVLTLILQTCEISTRIELSCVVERVVFTVGRSGVAGDGSTQKISNPTRIRSLSIQRFSVVQFLPKSFRIADPTTYDTWEDTYSDLVWKDLSYDQLVEIRSLHEVLQPTIAIGSSLPDVKLLGKLDMLQVEPDSQVSVEVTDARNGILNIGFGGEQPRARLTVYQPIRLITHHVEISKVDDYPSHAQMRTYETTLRDDDPWLTIVGQSSGPLILSLAVEPDSEVFRGAIPVSSIELSRLGEAGELVSTVTGDGVMRFPDYSKIEGVKIYEGDHIGLSGIDQFTIRKMGLAAGRGIQLHLHGIADGILIGQPGFQQDRTLSYLDALLQNRDVTILWTIVVGAAGALALILEMIRRMHE